MNIESVNSQINKASGKESTPGKEGASGISGHSSRFGTRTCSTSKHEEVSIPTRGKVEYSGEDISNYLLEMAHSRKGAKSSRVKLSSQPAKSAVPRDKDKYLPFDDSQEIRRILLGVGIDKNKHNQIIALKPFSMEEMELKRKLKYEVKLEDAEVNSFWGCVYWKRWSENKVAERIKLSPEERYGSSFNNPSVKKSQVDTITTKQAIRINPELEVSSYKTDETTCSSMKNNSIGLDKETIERTAGHVRKPETKDALHKVAFRVSAGIQASNNNCCLASFFMSISHNGLLDKLIEDAEEKVGRLRASEDRCRASSLKELVVIMKKFNTGGNIDNYISNDELDSIRLRYGLRAAALKHEVAVDALNKKGQIVQFKVGSDFNRGDALNAHTRAASMSLNISTKSVQGSYARIVSLPDPSLGYMRLRGGNLAIGQQLTQADLEGVEFVPLGEVLEPMEFIPLILDEIYECSNTESGASEGLCQLERSMMSLKQKVSMVEIQHDRKTISIDSIPSVCFDQKIEDVLIPQDYTLDDSKTVKKPHCYVKNITGEEVKYYYKDNILRLELTRTLHYIDGHEYRKVFKMFDQTGKHHETTIVEMEKHISSGKKFIRSKNVELVNNAGQEMVTNYRMTGYGENGVQEGYIKTHVSQRVGDFEGLMDVFIESWKDRFDDIDQAKRAFLPDKNSSPDVIFMTIPSEGKNNRCNFDWQKDVGIPMYGSDQRIPYEVSALMAIEKSHYLSWGKDRDKGLIHFADSMGDIDDSNCTLPLVVTMPDQDTEAALDAAHQNINGVNNYYKEAKNRLKDLGGQVALVILKRKQ